MRDDLAERRLLSPEALYVILSGAYVFFFTMVITVNLVFQTQDAHLNPFQLLSVGMVFVTTRFLCEIPTGIVADLLSRRLSILIGLLLVGSGLMLGGAFAWFETIILAQVIWGCGLTFISGAKEAWITDEVGLAKVGSVFLRTTQVEQLAKIVGGLIAVGLGAIQVNLPILIGGGLMIPLALFLAVTMPERGFTPNRDLRPSLRAMTATFADGSSLIRGNAVLMTMFLITFCYMASSVSLERLWVAHFLENVGLPSLMGWEPVIWFGMIRTIASALSIVSLEAVRRFCDTSKTSSLMRVLIILYGVLFISYLTLSLVDSFAIALIALWGIATTVAAYEPLFLTWLNSQIDSRVRATVISMNSQLGALGEIGGGPVFGAIGSLVALRAALFAGSLFLIPGLLLYGRVYGLSPAQRSVETIGASDSDFPRP